MNEKQKIAAFLPDLHVSLDLTSEAALFLLRRLFEKAQATGELPTPTSNIEQGIAWQEWRALAGLPPDDGARDSAPWHTARFGAVTR